MSDSTSRKRKVHYDECEKFYEGGWLVKYTKCGIRIIDWGTINLETNLKRFLSNPRACKRCKQALEKQGLLKGSDE